MESPLQLTSELLVATELSPGDMATSGLGEGVAITPVCCIWWFTLCEECSTEFCGWGSGILG